MDDTLSSYLHFFSVNKIAASCLQTCKAPRIRASRTRRGLRASVMSSTAGLLAVLAVGAGAIFGSISLDPDMNKDKSPEPHHSLSIPMDQSRVRARGPTAHSLACGLC